jgi:hypothetical protein
MISMPIVRPTLKIDVLKMEGILDWIQRGREGILCVSLDDKPKFLDRLKCESKMKTTKKQGVEACSLAPNIMGVEGRVGVLGWD